MAGLLLVRTIAAYAVVLVALRVMGKREIGKLSVFDLVVSIMIAEISAMSLQDTRIPLWHGIFIIAVLVLLQVAVSQVSFQSLRMHDLIEGKPSVLIARGRIDDREMKRTRYNLNDLLMQLREKGIRSVVDVEFAILETSGKLSVFPKERSEAAEGLVKPAPFATTLVADGKLDADQLTALGLTREWLRAELQKQGFASIEEVFYAGWDGMELHLDRKDGASAGKETSSP